MRAASQGLVLLLLCVAIAGCGDQKTETRTIGISVQTLTNPFFGVIADTVESEAAQHGYKVLVRDGDRRSDPRGERGRHSRVHDRHGLR